MPFAGEVHVAGQGRGVLAQRFFTTLAGGNDVALSTQERAMRIGLELLNGPGHIASLQQAFPAF